MFLSIKPYKKKNGEFMLFINGSNNVSVGISDRVYTSKFTKGQKNVWSAFFKALEEVEPVIKDFKELSEHEGISQKLDNGIKMYITDNANVAGNRTGVDGLFLSYENKLYNTLDFSGKEF